MGHVYNTLPSRFKGLCRTGRGWWWTDCETEVVDVFLDRAEQLHIGTHPDDDIIHKTRTNSSQTKAQHGRGKENRKPQPWRGIYWYLTADRKGDVNSSMV